MGLVRSFLKKVISKVDKTADKEGERLDHVVDTLSKTGSVIAEDALDFAKRTFHHVKDAATDLKEVSKEATKDIRERAKEDYNDVKEIAERRMHETRDIVKEKIDQVKTKTEEVVEEVKEEVSEKPKSNISSPNFPKVD